MIQSRPDRSERWQKTLLHGILGVILLPRNSYSAVSRPGNGLRLTQKRGPESCAVFGGAGVGMFVLAESSGVFVSGLHATRLVTRTKESNVCASHWVRVETQRQNESESLRIVRTYASRMGKGRCRSARTYVPRCVGETRSRNGQPQSRGTSLTLVFVRRFSDHVGTMRRRCTQSVPVRTREMMNYTWSG